jgi:hypothetical protein
MVASTGFDRAVQHACSVRRAQALGVLVAIPSVPVAWATVTAPARSAHPWVAAFGDALLGACAVVGPVLFCTLAYRGGAGLRGLIQSTGVTAAREHVGPLLRLSTSGFADVEPIARQRLQAVVRNRWPGGELDTGTAMCAAHLLLDLCRKPVSDDGGVQLADSLLAVLGAVPNNRILAVIERCARSSTDPGLRGRANEAAKRMRQRLGVSVDE